MNIQAPFTFVSVYSLWVWRFVGLRLWAVVVAFGKLWVFLASGPYFTRAGSSGFESMNMDVRAVGWHGVSLGAQAHAQMAVG